MSAERSPVWLLDVDGVLDVDRPDWPTPPQQHVAHVGGEDYQLRWAPTLIDQLRSWHTAGCVELRWASTWCPHAGELQRASFGTRKVCRGSAVAVWAACVEVIMRLDRPSTADGNRCAAG